ncbi:MAG: NifU-like protein [Microgenomates group bacterium ADurb.Bin219]|nr:MAG: NifU-like protein [Microgenomates group bacterium ADurb.Bin219]HNP89065.1 iron-sulfur cluster assembly scaffold protein [Candidatus Woesebacteria bacterium]
MANINQLYSKKVLDHFFHPRNMGEMKNPDGVSTVGNPVCGDVMRMFIKVKNQKVKGKSEEVVEDVKFQTLGCGAAIATSSMATELIKGKTLAQAEKLTNKAVMEALDGLPPAKTHCSILAEEAVRKAIEDYKNKLKTKSEK